MKKEQNLDNTETHTLNVMPRFDSPKNWKKDYKHENGNYVCKCYQCNEYFFGHKRRFICKECSDKYDSS